MRQWKQVRTQEILTKYKEKAFAVSVVRLEQDSWGTGTLSLKMLKTWLDKDWNNLL